MTDSDLIAAYLAKNSVTRCETGARNYSERALYVAAREGGKAVAYADIAAERENRALAAWDAESDAFRAGMHAGWSREDSIDYARDVRAARFPEE